ncbi:MAG TPA: PilZ domain-containing protein [Candidatus Acidoferrales bacterium]|nr:PilZ domain-containing protein [Candidatus Acidoferrales bacterium]
MSTAIGTDWTRILSDPDLVRQVGKLLQTYREAPAEKREEALLEAMREIKAGARREASSGADSQASSVVHPVPTPASATPPFEPDFFSPNWGTDRRRHPRMKCFVAVELRVDEASTPIWGNLSNTSAGGCLVETANSIKSGSKVEIGLWVPNGKIWVKGFALSGVVTRSGPTTGVRVRFDGMAPTDRENLRQFLKFVQDSTRNSQSENSYIQLLR